MRCILDYLLGILFSPLHGCLLVLAGVGLVDLGNLGHQGIVWIGVAEQRADREKDLGQGEGGGPGRLEDGAGGIDVGMVDPVLETQLWRPKQNRLSMSRRLAC